MPDTQAPPLPGYEEPSPTTHGTIHHLLHGVRVPGLLSFFLSLSPAAAMVEQVGVLVAKCFLVVSSWTLMYKL
jgi:hypothetical protein